MEAYVSPACTIETILDEDLAGWMPIDCVTLISSAMISVGLVIAAKKAE